MTLILTGTLVLPEQHETVDVLCPLLMPHFLHVSISSVRENLSLFALSTKQVCHGKMNKPARD